MNDPAYKSKCASHTEGGVFRPQDGCSTNAGSFIGPNARQKEQAALLSQQHMRNTPMPFRLLLLAALLALDVPASPHPAVAAAPLHYTVTDLRTLGGKASQPYSINDHGQVVGQAQTLAGDWHAFLWSDGKMLDLATLGGKNSEATHINDDGVVYGNSDVADGTTHEFRWWNGHLQDTGPSPKIGLSWQSGYIQKHHLVPTKLTLVIQNVNPEGHAAAGNSYFMVNGNYNLLPHGYLWTDKHLVDLGRIGVQRVNARDINDDDQIVGSASISERVAPSGIAFVDSGTQQALTTHAFLWQQGHMTDLNKCIPPNSGWQLGDAFAINNRGQIAGDGLHNGEHHAFLLAPTRR